MIERYSRPQMSAIWSLESQFRTWLDVEVLACEGWAKIGKIPEDAMQAIREKADFDLDKVLEKEKETKHDVAAFVSEVQRHVGDAGRFIHLGMTSSDVVDTAFAYRMRTSAGELLKGIDELLKVTQDRAQKDQYVPMIGRTHGIHAEPTTMGLKWLYWHSLLKRAKTRLEMAREEVSVGKLSGAVGTYTHMPPEVEAHVCEKLGLRVDTLSTQVIARDRFASYFSTLGLLGSCIELISVELRHLQRTEVGEVREGFTPGQKGSSAMPHKRNPISAENLTGLSRMLRSYVVPAMENVALWHERDISHSSVERIIGPDANILADYMLARLKTLLTNLEVFPQKMEANLNLLQGVVYSQRVLLALVESGYSRDEAYQIIQRNALKALDQQIPLKDLLKQDAGVSEKLDSAELDKLFDPKLYFKHVDYLYEKVLGK